MFARWAIQFLCEASELNAFQDAELRPELARRADRHLDQFAAMANDDPSPIVRLYLASAVQRLPFADDGRFLQGLRRTREDVRDHNLPRMYWFALEPMVPSIPTKRSTRGAGKIPALQEFVARRLVTGDRQSERNCTAQDAADPGGKRTIGRKVAPGFEVQNVGEGGVVHHQVFRNHEAVQTHPLDRNITLPA